LTAGPKAERNPSSAGLSTSSGMDTRSRTDTGAETWFRPKVRTSTDMEFTRRAKPAARGETGHAQGRRGPDNLEL